MNIKRGSSPSSYFDTLPIAGVFEYKGGVYMKTSSTGWNAVNLSNGELETFENEDLVRYWANAVLKEEEQYE